MRRIVLAIVATVALSASAHAQAISASRLYKLCWMEDPECLPTLRTVYFLAMAKLSNQTHMARFTCAKGNDLSDQLMFTEFMFEIRTVPTSLNYTAIEAEMDILSSGYPTCGETGY